MGIGIKIIQVGSKMKKTLICLSLVFTAFVYAGDIEKGKTKAAMCTSCHGVDGNSSNPVWPKIAGQHEKYLTRQLELFKSGERKGTVMSGMTAALSQRDMEDISAFFASQKSNIGSSDENLIAKGKAIYEGGKSKLNIPACMACHGISGKGNPLSGYPVLASQHAAYTEQRLLAYKAGETVKNEGDVNGHIMAGVVKYLDDDEIKAVANYLQGLYSE